MKFTILISLVATIGGFLFGFDSGVIAGTVDGLKTAFDPLQNLSTIFVVPFRRVLYPYNI